DQLRQTNKTQHAHMHMLWDSDLPIQEYTDTHVYTTIYDQGSFVPIARLMWLRDDLPKVANDDIENLDNENNAIQVYHYHNDQLGTPNELTNEKGEVVWLADYEAWGEARVEMCWEHILVPQDESCARVGGEVLWREQVIDQI
uniref:RHS domain-containing protein n=1 Tax=uncultured Psychrobacter sp. TaxID=259303 RepID=UPI00259AE238